ncbi:MAG: pyrroloquinoline quinone biosynthesis protein [Verrucomicrobiota bacterium]
MHIQLLGTAAGGGFPQWNCNCVLCAEVRSGSPRLVPRTQSCVAISADHRNWFLLNASPDIRVQMENFPALQPRPGTTRGSPIQAVLLTNADLDHTLGLLLLREGNKLPVYASANTRDALTRGFALAPLMEFFCGIEWKMVSEKLTPLNCADGQPSGLLYQAFPVPGKPPRFMEKEVAPSRGDSVGYKIVDEKTGGTLVFIPDTAGVDDSMLPQLNRCDGLLFDGTFWSEHEMRERGAGNIAAAQMGHLPISGERGSLKILAALPAKHKVYVHINNTNPILLDDSPEQSALAAANIQVGRDGMSFLI